MSIWQYRAHLLRSVSGSTVIERVRIVAEGGDGDGVTELEVVNGNLQTVPETRKFIRDGVLYIEREGVTYDARGQVISEN